MKINEIFYSLQGEGVHTGVPMVFVRFAGCNLHCPFCDTDHLRGREMSVAEIVEAASTFAARRVVLTGGEPTLQLTAELIDALHRAGFKIHVETNGTRLLPAPVDWLVCSPKEGGEVVATDIDELKVVFVDDGSDYERFLSIPAKVYSLQPCDTGNGETNLRIADAAVDYIKRHPHWRLSLQTHKLLHIP